MTVGLSVNDVISKNTVSINKQSNAMHIFAL